LVRGRSERTLLNSVGFLRTGNGLLPKMRGVGEIKDTGGGEGRGFMGVGEEKGKRPRDKKKVISTSKKKGKLLETVQKEEF